MAGHRCIWHVMYRFGLPESEEGICQQNQDRGDITALVANATACFSSASAPFSNGSCKPVTAPHSHGSYSASDIETFSNDGREPFGREQDQIYLSSPFM